MATYNLSSRKQQYNELQTHDNRHQLTQNTLFCSLLLHRTPITKWKCSSTIIIIMIVRIRTNNSFFLFSNRIFVFVSSVFDEEMILNAIVAACIQKKSTNDRIVKRKAFPMAKLPYITIGWLCVLLCFKNIA